MAEITIRAQEPEDVEALSEIFRCPGVIAGTLNLPLRSVQERRTRFAEHSQNVHRLVAECDGRLVGNLGLHLETYPRRRHCGSIGMAVHDDFQGRGVGSALMEAVIDLAENWLGLDRIELTVYVDNAAAIALYRKFGFSLEGTARDYALRNRDYVDAYFMARVSTRESRETALHDKA